MILMRVLIPLLIVGILVYIIVSILNKGLKDAKESKLQDEVRDVDVYIKRVTENLKAAEDRASRGIDSAIADIARYKQQLEVYQELKNKQLKDL